MNPGTEDLYPTLRGQVVHMIGVLIGVLLTGVLLTLGIASIFLLSSKKSDGGLSKRNQFLRLYIIILLLVVLTLDIEAFILGNYGVIFSPQSPHKMWESLGIWGQALGSTMLVVGFLTDGVFVWRCFMVQRALGPYNSSKWRDVWWVIPACLWILTLVAGSISVALFDVRNPVYPDIPGAIAVASNSALNIYVTVFLTIRLLAHRKMVISVLGDKALTLPHLCIVRILLESAAINVPIAIAVAVGLGTGRTFGGVVGLIAPQSQALTSVIIIHQVTLDRAFSQGREDGLRMQVDQNQASTHEHTTV